MVTSFSDCDGVVVGVVVGAVVVVVVVSTLSMLFLLSIVVIDDDVVDEEELNVSSSSGRNVGKEIDTKEPFKPVVVDSPSSSSSPKGDMPITLVPSSVLWTSPVLPAPPPPPPAPPAPPRTLRRMTGPRTRMISPIIALTFDSIL